MSFQAHWKKFGKKKGKSQKQWQSKYDKYLLKVEEAIEDAVDDIDDEEELVYTMSPPQNFKIAPPEDPNEIVIGQMKPHKQIRQINERTQMPQTVAVLKPVFRNKSGRNLLGTSGDNITQDLVEQ